MRKILVIAMFFIAEGYAAEERTFLDGFVGLLRTFRLRRIEKHRSVSEMSRSYKRLSDRHKLQEDIPNDVPFPCDSKIGFRSPTVPNSVHKLRPGDIDVIGAIGDSLTAGFGLGATNLFEVNLENRGKSFSIGGEKTWRQFFTLPNILKEFNPKLIGYSLKTSYTIERASQFNVAEGGAVSKNMPYMTKVLITRITKDERIQLKKDWKMITIMFGNNDFCSEICYFNDLGYVLERHKKDLTTVLRLIRDHLPRTIVNVIPPPHLKILTQMKKKPDVCRITHPISCPCIIGLKYQSMQGILFDFMRRWQIMDIEISNYPEFDLEDFTVVPHRYTLNYTFPRTSDGNLDFSFLSEDCFHLSQKGNARFANDLWNSILEPVGKKSTDGSPFFSKFNCPSRNHPFIFTRRNSN